MAENQEPDVCAEEDQEITPGYKPPAPKQLDDIVNQDKEDESLQKYKQALLGDSLDNAAIPFPENDKRVIVTKLAVLVEDHDDLELDLTGDTNMKKKPLRLKEGCKYRVKIYFYVQREIVTGLKYLQKCYRNKILVDKACNMVGSYGPKMEEQSYTTPTEEAPSGLIARGSYTMKSVFTDDDGNEHLKWDWTLEIKKDWKE